MRASPRVSNKIAGGITREEVARFSYKNDVGRLIANFRNRQSERCKICLLVDSFDSFRAAKNRLHFLNYLELRAPICNIDHCNATFRNYKSVSLESSVHRRHDSCLLQQSIWVNRMLKRSKAMIRNNNQRSAFSKIRKLKRLDNSVHLRVEIGHRCKASSTHRAVFVIGVVER